MTPHLKVNHVSEFDGKNSNRSKTIKKNIIEYRNGLTNKYHYASTKVHVYCY